MTIAIILFFWFLSTAIVDVLTKVKFSNFLELLS